jgi:amyloid beta A4 precursor protein-binding family B protein 1-interacting protein
VGEIVLSVYGLPYQVISICFITCPERVYEDHELLVENLMMWTRDSKNKLLFLERPDKTELFSAPENFLLSHSDRRNTDFDDHARAILLEVLY